MEEKPTGEYLSLPERIEKDTFIKENMTEQTTASPIMNILPNGNDGGRDGSGMESALAGILPLAFLAPLLRGFGNNENGGRNLEAVIADQIGDLRHEIGENTISALKQSFEADKDAIKAGFEAKIETLKAISEIDNKIDCKVGEVSKQVDCMKSDMDNKFCELSHSMERGFAHVAERELKEEISSLKDQISTRGQSDVIGLLSQLVTLLGGVPTPVALAKKA